MKPNRIAAPLLCLLLSLGCVSSKAQGPAAPLPSPSEPAADSDYLDALAATVAAQISPSPKVPEGLFDASFLAALPLRQLEAVYATLHEKWGLCRVGGVKERPSKEQAIYLLDCDKGYRVELSLSAPEETKRIAGLWFKNAVSTQATSFDALRAELAALPGKVSALAVPLAGGEPLLALEAESPRALGSIFKLYVLATLFDSIKNGQHRWDEVVLLRPEWRSLPSGQLQDWPVGTPVTLATLADLMISRSDNTATDALIGVLGREAIEGLATKLGNRSQRAPFLTTREAFNLKDASRKELASRYVAASAKERRALLSQNAGAFRTQDLALPPAPYLIDEVEWFATPRELAALFAHLKEASPLALETLAINPGTRQKELFQYAGFKGGSEPGVLSLAYLVQTRKGDWYTVSVLWNDSERSVDEGKLVDIAERLLRLVAEQLR